MNQTTKETRRRSYDAVLPKRAARCRLILETLGNRELTASEITEELVAAGRIPYFNRNYVAPRLTELKEIGILTTVGRRKATRSDATEAVWARAEPSGPTGQTAAAYADNPTEAEQMTLGFKKYNELLDTMIPDEPEPILSPHQPGDGGILTMPLRDNVPEPPTDDWQLTTCPVCGAECWQTDTARRILTLEPDVRTACTACALKGLGK